VPPEQVVNQVLRRGLEADVSQRQRNPSRGRTFAMGQPLVPSLDKSLVLAAALEDEEIARKLALRKSAAKCLSSLSTCGLTPPTAKLPITVPPGDGGKLRSRWSA
jgi:hypothetical protein